MQISYVVDVFKAILVWRLVQEWIFVSSIAQEMQYFLKSLDKLITLEFPHTVMVRSLTQITNSVRSIAPTMANVIMIAMEMKLC